MITQLRVVNDCLAIMGETSLASLSEEHEYKGPILSKLEAESTRIQSKGWWYNMETLTLTASPVDGRITPPLDAGAAISLVERPNLAMRGRVVYDLENGTDVFPAGTVIKARISRVLPIEDVPVLVGEYIAASVVLAFQSLYDGDQTKTRNLGALLSVLQADAMSEHIRNRKVNLLDSNARLSSIRFAMRRWR